MSDTGREKLRHLSFFADTLLTQSGFFYRFWRHRHIPSLSLIFLTRMRVHASIISVEGCRVQRWCVDSQGFTVNPLSSLTSSALRYHNPHLGLIPRNPWMQQPRKHFLGGGWLSSRSCSLDLSLFWCFLVYISTTFEDNFRLQLVRKMSLVCHGCGGEMGASSHGNIFQPCHLTLLP